MTLDSFYFGMIQAVYDPTKVENASKYQYEYQVVITVDDYASIPVRCIRADASGGHDNFDDLILEVGSKVMVRFPRGDRSLGIIECSTRNYVAPQNPALGVHWRNRFNKIVRYIDKDGNYSVTSDQGPNLHVKTDKVVLDDSVGEQIILDKASKTLFIKADEWKIDLTGNMTMNVAKNSTINVTGDVKVSVKGNAEVDVTGDAKVKAKNIEATAKMNAKVKAKLISLNGEVSGITTENSHFGVVDFLTGVPVNASKTVKGDV